MKKKISFLVISIAIFFFGICSISANSLYDNAIKDLSIESGINSHNKLNPDYYNRFATMSLATTKKTTVKYADCGKIKSVPVKFMQLTNQAVNIIQVAIPVILIIMKGIDFIKAITAQKEDEIKKAQSLFIKRIILAALVYFVFVIVKLIISIVGNSDNIINCVECFINDAGKCS